MIIDRLLQFHEDPLVIAWWRSRLGTALAWFTPPRRRTILAVAAVYDGVRRSLREVAKADGLPVPSDWLGLASLVLALFAMLWLLYRAAVHFRSLPAVVRRHPQLSVHLLYRGSLVVLWLTAPTAGAGKSCGWGWRSSSRS